MNRRAMSPLLLALRDEARSLIALVRESIGAPSPPVTAPNFYVFATASLTRLARQAEELAAIVAGPLDAATVDADGEIASIWNATERIEQILRGGLAVLNTACSLIATGHPASSNVADPALELGGNIFVYQLLRRKIQCFKEAAKRPHSNPMVAHVVGRSVCLQRVMENKNTVNIAIHSSLAYLSFPRGTESAPHVQGPTCGERDRTGPGGSGASVVVAPMSRYEGFF